MLVHIYVRYGKREIKSGSIDRYIQRCSALQYICNITEKIM